MVKDFFVRSTLSGYLLKVKSTIFQDNSREDVVIFRDNSLKIIAFRLMIYMLVVDGLPLFQVTDLADSSVEQVYRHKEMGTTMESDEPRQVMLKET